MLKNPNDLMNSNTLNKKLEILKKASQTNRFLLGKPFKDLNDETLSKHSKTSKFAKIIHDMSDDNLMLLAYIMFFDNSIAEALKCYAHAVDGTTQVFSLIQELEKRGITVNK